MSELYQRVLLWHKLVAQTTGGLALCSAKRTLPREEATRWADALQNVSDEIREVLAGRPFILDDKGQRMVGSGTAKTGSASRFFNKEGEHEVAKNKPISERSPKQAVSPTVPRAGGLRIAKRKT
jgi:hypothetical protein